MRGLISAFIRHPVAPNLAMAVMVLAGVYALGQLSRQLLPSFQLDLVNVEVSWPGAAAEDVKAAITQPLEDQLRTLDQVKRVTSTSRDGKVSVVLEFAEGADMGRALDQVKDRVAQIRNFPPASEPPVVSQLSRNEPVAKLLVVGPDLATLRPIVRRFERELRGLGIARIDILGLPEEEIAVQVPGSRLSELNVSLQEIAGRIRAASQDVPAGSVGTADVSRQLRSADQRRSVDGFNSLPVAADQAGRLLVLRDIATVERRARADQPLVFVDGRPAVELFIQRSESADALDVAATLYAWLERARPTVPATVSLQFYDEPWRQVADRISLITSNGLAGILLVLGVLFLFLNGRVAIWVAVGIPVALMAGFMALYLAGGTINVISLFAMVMAMGVLADDAIVVGEETASRFAATGDPTLAAEQAAQRMFAPVTAAALTTVAAFVPLMTIGGPGGAILFAIPLIMSCVIVASVLECFLVLPGHLRHALAGGVGKPPGRFRQGFDAAFDRFRQGPFARLVGAAITNRGTTASIAVAAMIIAIGLLAGGRLQFTLLPQPDEALLQANVRFVAGTPEERVRDFVARAWEGLERVEQEAGEPLVELRVSKLGLDAQSTRGSHVATLGLQLRPVDQRSWTNAAIIRAWRAQLPQVPGLESFVVTSGAGHPSGADVELRLTGTDLAALKSTSLAVQEALAGIAGVSGPRDDTSYGKEQLIVELSAAGKSLGLSSESLGGQLRAAFAGELVQTFQDQGEEIEVRVLVSDREREGLGALATLPVALPTGNIAPLSDVATLRYGRGFEGLKGVNGDLAITVTADVDDDVSNNNVVRSLLVNDILPAIISREGVAGYSFGGDAESQQGNLKDISLALPLALMLVYIILAWVFASYTWPLVVLAIVPFSLAGALFGHWLLGFDVTLMSIFGMFGLTGVVINDSIVLVSVYRELREQGMAPADAARQAGQRRLRAVVLTSSTTLFGLTPLLLETAPSAQFLKPLVISLAFGLLVAAWLVLLLIPALLVGIESVQSRLSTRLGRLGSDLRLAMAGIVSGR